MISYAYYVSIALTRQQELLAEAARERRAFEARARQAPQRKDGWLRGYLRIRWLRLRPAAGLGLPKLSRSHMMQRALKMLPALTLAAVTVLSLAAGVSAHASVAEVVVPSDPAGVLQHFQDARNQGDVDGAMQLVSDEISFVGGASCTPQDPCVGADSFRQRVEQSIADQVHSITLGDALVSGTTVGTSVLATSPGRAALGLDRTLSEVTAEVVDGKIVSIVAYPDSDDAQTLWWLDHRPDPTAGQGAPTL